MLGGATEILGGGGGGSICPPTPPGLNPDSHLIHNRLVALQLGHSGDRKVISEVSSFQGVEEHNTRHLGVFQ